jgi:dihydrofolate reductase
VGCDVVKKIVVEQIGVCQYRPADRSNTVTEIAVIAAMANHRLAGRNGEIPWYAPVDLRRFRSITIGGAVIMGARTWESLGRPLTDRQNIVLTRSGTIHGVQTARSLEAAIALVEPRRRAYVIGGQRPWTEAIGIASRAYLTEIAAEFDGDVYFPPLDDRQWREVRRERVLAPVDGVERELHFVDFERVPESP